MFIANCYWKIGNVCGAWPQVPLEPPPLLPPLVRRRLTPLGQLATKMLYQSDGELNGKEIPWIVSCRHGDAKRIENLLVSLDQKTLLSPTEFSLSVHNAIIGMFSIITQNSRMQTALSGAQDCFEVGLLEAYALQKEENTVGYIYYHQPLSQEYQDIFPEEDREVCITLIFGEKDKKLVTDKENSAIIKVSYGRTEELFVSSTIEKIIFLTEFLENNEKEYKISVPGGVFLLERHSP